MDDIKAYGHDGVDGPDGQGWLELSVCRLQLLPIRFATSRHRVVLTEATS